MTINEANYNDVLLLRQQALYPEKDMESVKLPDDDMGIHMGVFEADKLVGVVSLFMHPNRTVQFRKLAIRPDMQGKGYGDSLLRWLIDYACDVKLNKLWCNARVEVVGFYKKEGFAETKERFVRDGHSYVIMEKVFGN